MKVKNKMTYLQKLETAIRKALPELMELSYGVEVIVTSKKHGTSLTMRPRDIPENKPDEWEIIGHPVTILHLLRWLDIVCNKHSFQYSITDTCLYTTRPFKTYKLNLSKPLLSQQSQEVIDELVKLVK